MIAPEPAIADVVRRVLETSETGDFPTVRHLFSERPELRVGGSDPDEWWVGPEETFAFFEQQSKELAGVPIEAGPIEAWADGALGWALARPWLIGPDGTRSEARLSVVLHRDDGRWRIIAWVFAATVPNEALLGIELTTSVERLLRAVEQDRVTLDFDRVDGPVAVVFTDIEGSTAAMERLGEQRWLDLLRWHDQVIRRCVETFGGQVVRSTGDGFLVAFPTAPAAAAFAISVQQRVERGWHGEEVAVRIGAHVGTLLERGGDIHGRTVVMAARVAERSAGRRILVSEDFQRAAGGGVETFVEREVTALKGLPDEHRLYELVWRPVEWTAGVE